MDTHQHSVLALSIRNRRAPKDGFLLWWLGQNSFVYKGAQGSRIAIDPYLSDWCASYRKGAPPNERSRLYPPPIPAAELDCDWILLTHSHCDHADPETLEILASQSDARVLGGRDAILVAREAGFTEERCVTVSAGEEYDLGDGLRVRASFALPTDGSDLNHLGFLILAENGSSFWDSGDTAWCELLGELSTAVLKNPDGTRVTPDVFAVCINAGYGNLSHWEAAKLCGAAKPRVAVPTHWDLFPHNSLDPYPFKNSLSKHAPGTRYAPLERGACYQWTAGELKRE